MNFKKPKRVWINAPSKHNDLYPYHGKTGIAHTNEVGTTTVYFEKGKLISITVNPLYLKTKNSQANIFEL